MRCDDQCEYIQPSTDGGYNWYCCVKKQGHEGDHEAYAVSSGKWMRRRDFRCRSCGRPPSKSEL